MVCLQNGILCSKEKGTCLLHATCSASQGHSMEWMNLAGREQTVGLHLGRVQNWTKLISGDEVQPLVTSGRGEAGTGQEGASWERRAEDEAGSGSQWACIYLCAIFKDYFFLSFFFFFFGHAACWLVPQPGIKSVSSAVESWSPNHWTSREFPVYLFLKKHDFWVCLCRGSRMMQSFELMGSLKQMAFSGHQPTCCWPECKAKESGICPLCRMAGRTTHHFLSLVLQHQLPWVSSLQTAGPDGGNSQYPLSWLYISFWAAVYLHLYPHLSYWLCFSGEPSSQLPGWFSCTVLLWNLTTETGQPSSGCWVWLCPRREWGWVPGRGLPQKSPMRAPHPPPTTISWVSSAIFRCNPPTSFLDSQKPTSWLGLILPRLGWCTKKHVHEGVSPPSPRPWPCVGPFPKPRWATQHRDSSTEWKCRCPWSNPKNFKTQANPSWAGDTRWLQESQARMVALP